MGKPSFNEPEITHKSKKMKLFATLAAVTSAQLGAPVSPMNMMPAMPSMDGLMGGMGGMNPMLMMSLLGDDSGMDSDLLMMMMIGGMGGMNPLLMMSLFDDDKVDVAKLEKICADLDAGTEKDTCDANLLKVIISAIEKTEIDCAATGASATCAEDKKTAIADIKALKKSDMSDIMMLMMMSGQGGMGNINSMLPLLLMKDGGLGDNKMLMMMMSGGMGGQGGMGGMNPLLMMSLLE